ncbi:MAG: tRNA-dihydrouridine synthase family protein [Bacteroidales bacterium]|jgi:tRNA-dihydrouridine synthase B|nr:tRNA-dihydrouridine synthase family protein [Bacteroidales bacterium]
MQLYLAPLQGYTEFLFRNAYARHFGGIDKTIAPFLPSGLGVTVKHKRIKDLWKEHNELIPIDPQILGKSAPEIVPVGKYLFDYGYDTLNINMGCPIPTIRAKMRGSGILAYPEMVEMLLEKLYNELQNKISLKIRLGNESAEEVKALIPVINQFPLKELIIHPRIGTQMYEGTVDLDSFSWCVENAKAPIVYSGDIFDLATFKKMQNKFPGISRWMIGRGLLFSPFLPEIIKKNDCSWVKDELYRFWEFHNDLEDEILTYRDRPKNQLNKLKEYWRYFSQAFNDSENIFFKISRAADFENFRIIIDEIRKNGIWRAGLTENDQFTFIKFL